MSDPLPGPEPAGEPGGPGEAGRSFYLRLTTSLYIATFSIRVGYALLFVALPLYMEELEGRYLSYALVLSVWPLTELATVFGFGAYIDRQGRRGVLLLGASLASLALLLLTVSSAPMYVAAVNALLGVSAAAVLVSSLALMADYAPQGDRGREMGIFEFVQLFGWFFGFAVGGVLVEVLSDSVGRVFVVGAGLAAGGAVYARLNVREPLVQRVVTDRLTLRHLVSVLRRRSVMLVTLPWLIIYLIIGTAFAFAFKASFEELGLSGYQVTGLLAAVGAGLLVMLYLYGRLSDLHGRGPLMTVGAVGMVGAIAMAVVVVAVSPDGDPTKAALDDILPYLLPLGVFAVMALAFGPSALAGLVDVSPDRRTGMTMGLYTFLISLGSAVGPIVSGAIIDLWDIGGLVAYLAVCGLLLLSLVLWGWREERRLGVEDASEAVEPAAFGKP